MTSGNGFDPKRILSIQLNRRSFVKGTAAGAAALGIPSVMRPGHTVAQNATLNILALAWPQTPTEQQLATDVFTAETGIAVQIEQTQYDFMEQRIQQLVTGQSSDYDIYHYDSQWIGGMVARNALEPLDGPDYLGNSASTIKFEDFFPELSYRIGKYPTVDADLNAGNYDPSLPTYGLPWSLNAQALWYRTDLVQAPPTTWDQLREMAKGLTSGDVFGMAFEGSRAGDYVTVDFLPIMWSFGGQLWDPSTYTAEGYVNSPEAVQALQFMSDMVNTDKTVDPASGNWTINERLAAILQGKTAMSLNWVPLFGGIAEDEEQSLVAGNIAFAPSPGGPGGQFAMFGSQGTGINALSGNKEAAWQYLQWLESNETQRALMDEPTAGFLSARKDLQDAVQFPWQQALRDMIPMVRDMWNIPEYAPLLQALQTELNLGYIGRKAPQEALDDAATAHQAILDASPDKAAAGATGAATPAAATPVP